LYRAVTGFGDQIWLPITVRFLHALRGIQTPTSVKQRPEPLKRPLCLVWNFPTQKELMHPAARQELKQLVEIYALRTRQLSESIAVLGAHLTAQRPIDEIMIEVKKHRSVSERAATDLFAFVWPRPEGPSNK
jgi:hypothetical protein